MFNGTNLTLTSDLALVSTQVKTLLYLVGQKARESSDASMSTCDGVGHIPGHWKINKPLALLPSQLSILGHNRHASKTLFKWRFAGGPKRVR